MQYRRVRFGYDGKYYAFRGWENHCGANPKRDKTRAWFDKTIDISNIKEGNYAIYITNKSNLEDYGELNELLLRDLSYIKATIG